MDCFVCCKTAHLTLKIWEDRNYIGNIPEIIQLHLQWFQPLTRSKDNELICQNCWSQLDQFHQFYIEVQNANEFYNSVRQRILPPYSKEETDVGKQVEEGNPDCGLIQEDFISSSPNTLDVKENEKNPLDEVEVMTNFFPESLKEAFENFRPEDSDEGDALEISCLDIKNEVMDLDVEEDQTQVQGLEVWDKSNVSLNASIPKKPRKSQGENKESEGDDKSDQEIVARFIVMSCDFCAFVGKNFIEISNHLKEQHEVNKPYIVCCGRKLNKKSKIIEHAYKHQNPEIFKCNQCSKIFADGKNLKTHWLATHSPEEYLIYACDKCPKRFSRKHFLNLHLPSHIPENERTYFCSHCPQRKAFASEHKLQVHINISHKKSKNVCHVCAKIIKDKQLFEKHLRLHFEDSGPRIKCPRPDCDSWLKDQDNLKEHLRRHNDEGKLFLCSECGKSCKNKRALRCHLAYSHNNEVFKCEVCQKSFKKAITLKEHMAQHTGEALYKCPFCPRTFNSNANMHSHKKRMHPVEWDHWRKTKTVSAQKLISSNSLL